MTLCEQSEWTKRMEGCRSDSELKMSESLKHFEENVIIKNECRVAHYRQQWVDQSPSISQEAFSEEMDGGNPSFPSTTSLVPLSHKAVPPGHAVITHFTALILITANVNIRIININAQNKAIICNYCVALIFSPLSPHFTSFSQPSFFSTLV